jgi:hypothetical protein
MRIRAISRKVGQVNGAEDSGAGSSVAVDRRVPSLCLRIVTVNLDLNSRVASALPWPGVRARNPPSRSA